MLGALRPWLRGLRGPAKPDPYHRPPREQASPQAERVMTEILTRIARLQQKSGRIDLLREAGPPLVTEVPERDSAAEHLQHAVRVARRTGSLEALREALLRLEPHDIGVAWFDLAVTVMTVVGSLPADDMFDLIDALHTCPPEFGLGAVSAYAARKPLDTGPLPEVLWRLYDAQVDPDRRDAHRTAMLDFLALLEEDAATNGAGDGAARRIERIRRRHADRRHGRRHPKTAREVTTVPSPFLVVIQIRVDEEDAPSDLPYTMRQYSLRGFHYERNGAGPPVYRGSRSGPGLFTGDQLEARGRQFLADWREPAESARGVDKRVEFLLPHSLLGHPFELWPSGASRVPLSRSCQVVVRSLPRLRDSTIHDSWIRRWEGLDRGCTPGDALKRIGWICPDRPTADDPGEQPRGGARFLPAGKYPPLRLTDAADVERWLRKHADLACLGLGTPYDPHDPLIRDAVTDALLEDGIPAMVWRRVGGDPDHLLTALRGDGTPPALLAELPQYVQDARKRERRDSQAVGNQITLLWDDPTCVDSNQDHQMTGTRGTGGGAE